MNPAQLLAQFDRISDAPDAIPCLRRFILDLAVRGKLVAQDPGDEPASELLKRIQSEKERLVKAGEIRKGNPFPRVVADETPFASPTGWEWVRIRQVTSDRGQATPHSDFTYIDVTAINKEVGCVVGAKVLSASDAPSRARKLVRSGDVLYSCVRPYLLNVAVIENDFVPPPIASTAFAVLNGFGLVLSKYLWMVLRSPFMVEFVEGKMRGQAYPAINDSDFALLPFPLPPLAEQHCIVAKVDEIMALCDRLEVAQAERECRRDLLVASSLNRLDNGTDVNAFRGQARFYFNCLPRLTTRLEHIQQLRQTILNLAARGKLVPQYSRDETASELLKRIHCSRKHLRKFANLDLNELESSLPDIPSNWTWTVVDQIAGDAPNAITDGPFGANLKTEHYVTAPGYRVIRLQNIGRGIFHEEHRSYIDRLRYDRLSKHHVHPGDLIVAGLVDPFVRCCELPANFEPALVKADCYRFSVHPQVCTRFALHYLNSPKAQEFAAAHHHGMTLTRIGLGNFRRIPFPLPPITEQHRIVAKVEELMSFCDRLEAQLTTTQTESCRLLEATLHYALSA